MRRPHARSSGLPRRQREGSGRKVAAGGCGRRRRKGGGRRRRRKAAAIGGGGRRRQSAAAICGGDLRRQSTAAIGSGWQKLAAAAEGVGSGRQCGSVRRRRHRRQKEVAAAAEGSGGRRWRRCGRWWCAGKWRKRGKCAVVVVGFWMGACIPACRFFFLGYRAPIFKWEFWAKGYLLSSYVIK